MVSFHRNILRALLYYDMWDYPLTAEELYAFLPGMSFPLEQFRHSLAVYGPGELVEERNGYFCIKGRGDIAETRRARERHARMMWRFARVSAHIIKRFPFVRAIFISGDLSKNATIPTSDVDFFILAAPGRLWIARSCLILFKKAFLLNRKKFFCVNYFLTTDRLQLEEHNVYLATEVGHVKPLHGSALFDEFLAENSWIKGFFPNFDARLLPATRSNDRRSILQKLLEIPFNLLPADALDSYLLNAMKRMWRKRYPELDETARERMFRSTKTESRAYGGDFQDRILSHYEQRLRDFGVAD